VFFSVFGAADPRYSYLSVPSPDPEVGGHVAGRDLVMTVTPFDLEATRIHNSRGTDDIKVGDKGPLSDSGYRGKALQPYRVEH
jgi:hypothetical protein